MLAINGCGAYSPIQQKPSDAVSNPASVVPQPVITPTPNNPVASEGGTATVDTNNTSVPVSIAKPVYVVNPAYTEAINTAKEINTLANPTPFAPIVNWILGGISATLLGVATYKNKQASAGQVIALAIEKVDADPATKDIGNTIKTAISKYAANKGQSANVDKLVQSVN